MLQEIRQASRASALTYYFSKDNKCKTHGRSYTLATLFPKSKYLSFESGTPLQYLDFGYGLPV